MRRLSVILILLPVFVYGQQNIVPNPSFETYTNCPSTGHQLHFAQPWQNSGPPCSPDYFNACCPPLFYPPDHYVPTKGVPENGGGYQYARTGEAYAGFFAYSANANNGREFIQVELTQPVVAGVKYEVSFYVSLADKYKYAVRTLGAHFSDTLIVRDSYMIWNLNLIPQVQSPPDVLLDDKENWTEVRDTFSSRYGGEQFLTIGNFNLDEESGVVLLDSGTSAHAYYYIDDVSVIALDSLPNSVAEPEQGQRGFAVYPNPNHGEMTLRYRLEEGETGMLRMYSIVGTLVLQSPLDGSQDNMMVNVGGIGSGLYLLNVEVNGKRKLTERISILR